MKNETKNFIKRLTEIKVEAGELGLFKTMHEIDRAVKKVGFEVADQIKKEEKKPRRRETGLPTHRSKSGWWQALCGQDTSVYTGSWTNHAKDVTCPDCKRRMKKGEHLRRPASEVLHPDFDRARRLARGDVKPRRGERAGLI